MLFLRETTIVQKAAEVLNTYLPFHRWNIKKTCTQEVS